ncbi:MAG: DUF1080 domain-containing protein [Sedimentisphaerales bacterium]|nr:DUF1080 domain-containing protein [Sedimentisphaerales bacterium]
MKRNRREFLAGASCVSVGLMSSLPKATAQEDVDALPKACIDGSEKGWRALGEEDFTHVNCDPDTWTWKDGTITCTGTPIGVIQSRKSYKNFELVVQWRHLRSAGNSGVFVWATKESLDELKAGNGNGRLPKGIECQVLDHGYAEQYEERNKKKPDWFTTNGDVFAVGVKMKPFPPLSPDGSRSFPSKNRSKGVNQWNHYYIRCINGEVRLWVNGEEVSGGTDCQPREGFLCLESEGSPVEFKNLRIRELP